MAVYWDAKPQANSNKQAKTRGYIAYSQRKDSHGKECVSEGILVY